MFLQRYYLDCLSHASYMVADEATGEAAVIDPQRDIDLYLQDAAAQGFEIKHVILTHFHADFVAGHIELRDRVGAAIYLGSKATAEFEFQALSDGDSIELGAVRLTAMETPGHTPEGLTILVFDEATDPQTSDDPICWPPSASLLMSWRRCCTTLFMARSACCPTRHWFTPHTGLVPCAASQ